MSEILSIPTDELVLKLEPFCNLMPVLISGQHYDRATREEVLESAKELHLPEEDIEQSKKDIARYKKYEELVEKLAIEQRITREEIMLADSVLRKMKTVVTEEEKERVQKFIAKLMNLANGLEEYKDLFGE